MRIMFNMFLLFLTVNLIRNPHFLAEYILIDIKFSFVQHNLISPQNSKSKKTNDTRNIFTGSNPL